MNIGKKYSSQLIIKILFEIKVIRIVYKKIEKRYRKMSRRTSKEKRNARESFRKIGEIKK